LCPAPVSCLFCVELYQVLILSERLHSVTAQFDRLRSMRFQDAINRAMPRKNQKRPEKKPAEPSKSSLVLKSDVSKIVDQEASTAPMRVQEQLLDDETKALQVIRGWYINYSLVKNLVILLKLLCDMCMLKLFSGGVDKSS
jgi:hypothetical protein